MSELPVPVVSPPEPPKPQTLVCANCHADLAGEYCAACGQRHEPHIHTVAHFAGEAFESISHADSRLWRTLWFLFARPGFLTKEFFAGRRVAYLPPFRLYLVLSVLVLLFSTLSPDSPRVGSAPPTTGAAAVPAPATATPAATDALPPEAKQALEDAQAVAKEQGLPTAEEADNPQGWQLRIKGLDDFCRAFDQPETGEPGAERRDNVRQFCWRMRNDTSALFTALGHSLPKAMFIFLPLLAAIMELMYWRPKRYYVEHLLFLVHNHAAGFLLIILLFLFSFLPWLGDFTPLASFVAIGYMAWYVYRGMRNVYGQRGWLTLLKYTVLGFSYTITALFTLLLTLVFLAVFG
jgi:hypothetical protein